MRRKKVHPKGVDRRPAATGGKTPDTPMDHDSSISIKYHNTEIRSEGFCFSEKDVALIVYLWLYVWILNKEVLSCVGKHTHTAITP